MMPSLHPLREVVLLFLRLGFTAFGGPAAHIALMREEVVTRRKWLTDAQFLDLLGATNLIPGPNSTEMTMHIGYLRAGLIGLFAGGSAFILPAMLIVGVLAWAYTRYGSTPQAGWLFYGIQPVIIAIIFQALYGLGRSAVKGPLTALAGAAVLALYLLGANEILILLGTGLAVMFIQNLPRLRKAPPTAALALPWLSAILSDPQTGERPRWLSEKLFLVLASPYTLPVLFFTFLKIGAVLYGSGYVLLAFLRADFVERLGWLTDRQLLDAVAVGQITPGPLFTTATFIGYLMGGIPGAVVATVGIFLPGFIFVALSNPLIPRLRASPWAGALLDGVNVASLGLMAGVTFQLAQASLVDPLTVLLALAAGAVILKYKVNATWLVLAGAGVGVVSRLFF